MPGSPLGDYLRARRADVPFRPTDGAPPKHRRVTGLRREEVAALAGMSVDYYSRLEQGREVGPSSQMLKSLAVALALDGDASSHLERLARASNITVHPSSMDVHPQLKQLADSWNEQPALVLGPGYDVLHFNALAGALFDQFAFSRNLGVKVFLDPNARAFYSDWDEAAASTVAGLRLAHGEFPADPSIRNVLDYLTQSSGEFRDLWARQEARGKNVAAKTFLHPEVGVLSLLMQSFDVRASRGQQLIIFSAEPGTPSADALARLRGSSSSD
jgi:transcriptional regulator with XRE-family HTH domain